MNYRAHIKIASSLSKTFVGSLMLGFCLASISKPFETIEDIVSARVSYAEMAQQPFKLSPSKNEAVVREVQWRLGEWKRECESSTIRGAIIQRLEDIIDTDFLEKKSAEEIGEKMNTSIKILKRDYFDWGREVKFITGLWEGLFLALFARYTLANASVYAKACQGL